MATLARWKRYVNTSLIHEPAVGQVLSPPAIERLCREHGHRWRHSFWCPTTTVLTFLLQVLDGAKTLRAAVGLVLAQRVAAGRTDLPGGDPTAYCQARKRLPGQVLEALSRETAQRMQRLVTPQTGWLGRRVWIVDGSSVSMPDTPQLQQAFPQPSGQRRGCGFPVAQMVALFCWTTGALIDLAIDSIVPHEVSLWRRLWSHFHTGDVVLADRAYCSYVDLTRLLNRGVFCVVRLHQRRKVDFRRGWRLGPDDRLVTWVKPKQWRPSCGISREEFDRLPGVLWVRLVRISEGPRGFRSRTIMVATTLLDPQATPAEAIRDLYRDRWLAELNLRSIKTHLGMDVLRGQSLDVVRKEMAMHVLAYNLIRLIMWQAARRRGCDLHRLSFTGTLHRLRVVLPMVLCNARLRDRAAVLWNHLLDSVADDQLPHRPNRTEPRRRKRRPKPYSLLRRPRSYYKHHGDPGAR